MEQQGILTNNHCTGNLNGNRIYTAALYLRFSKDDGNACDSSSIETQQMTLEKYCQDNGYRIHDVYKDDGYTGLNFDRPDFQRLLSDIDNKKVNLVITKDLSRLGRDYIKTGFYSEIFFPDNGVRYIAINDGFDSLKSDNDIAPFKNILNNMYSKDLSRKVKSALRQRLNHGLYCFGQVPYGYKKHPDNKNKLVADEETAATVREIYRMALEGKGTRVISRELSGRQILVPSAYKALHGNAKYTRHHTGKEISPYKWSVVTLTKILRDRIYVGDTVGGRCEVVNTRTGKRQMKPKDQLIFVENTHEPLVSREDYDRVQQIMTARHRPAWRHNENIFRSILFCGQCGKRMHLGVYEIKTKKKAVVTKVIYRCHNHTLNPQECTQHNHIYYDVLKERVWESVKKVLTLMQSDSRMLEAVRKRIAGNNNSEKMLAEKTKIEKRLHALMTIVRKLYEDYAAERLDESGYQDLLAGYQAEKKTLTERLTALVAELGKTTDHEESLKKLRTLAAAYADSKELTSEIAHKFIERIELKRAEIIDGKEVRELNIVYRFININL
ncbi:resolvase [Clostridia bacterium]|nr:resolvase [Clostridia bacterium]